MGQIKKLYQDSGNVEIIAGTESNAVYPVTASSAVYHQSSWGTGGSGQSVSSILTALDQGYQYIGVASLNTTPITATHKIFYLASEAGVYSNFGGITVSGLTVLKNSGSGWSKEELNITSGGGGGGGGGGTVTGYIGTTQVQGSSGAQNLTGISNLRIESGGKIYFGGTNDVYIEYDSNGFHFSESVYSDGQVAAGGAGSGSGGGGGGSYTLPIASADTLGGIKVGAGLSIDSTTGVLSATGGGGGGTSYSAGAGIDITSGTISVTKASASALGGIKVGTGLSIDSSGVLSATGGGGGGGGTLTDVTLGGVSVVSGTVAALPAYPTSLPASDVSAWAKASTKPSYNFSEIGSKPTTLSGYGITDAKIQSGVITLGSNTITPLTSHQTIYALTLQAGTFANGTYTPNSAAKTFNIPTTLDHISDGTNRKLSDYVTLHTTQNNIDGEKTFTTNPVHIGSSSGIDVDGSSYIDIGNARLVYDSGAKALHVKNKSGVTDTISFFADGFVSAGGTAAQSTISFVTLEGNQTISGDKEFGGNITFNGVTYLTSYVDAQSDLAVGGDISLSGKINALTISSQTVSSYKYVTLSADRLYLQNGSNDVILGSGSGKVIVGSHPGSTAIGSNKFYVDGTAIATAWNTSSDSRLKDNISPIEGAIDLVMALKPSKWVWNSGDVKGKVGVGLIAQDVEAVAPWMVESGEYKSLNYQMLHGFELSAIQNHEMRLRKLEEYVKQ